MNELIAILGLSLIVSFYLASDGRFKLADKGASNQDTTFPDHGKGEGANEEGSQNIRQDNGQVNAEDNGGNKGKSNAASPTSQDKLFLIEHLTQHLSTFRKNYRTPAENHIDFGYNVEGKLHANGQDVNLTYSYPILKGKTVTFTACLNPTEVSQVVDQYGATLDGTILKGVEIVDLDGKPTFMPQFAKVVHLKNQLTLHIANHIVDCLQKLGKDDYESRVLAAKNFVQHLPYGIPEFKQDPFHYNQLALPCESFVLSYGDCDSKSVFMAAILKEMINAENILLFTCKTQDPNVPGGQGGHMFIGVAGMSFRKSSKENYNGKTYHFIETTSPHFPDGNPIPHISDVKPYSMVV
jgi:hypothetical protein